MPSAGAKGQGKLKELKARRRSLQNLTWIGLPMVLVGGWFFPRLGFFLLLCMVGANAFALYRGRSWCDWMCPRGSFYDLFLSRISAQREIPAFVRTRGFRFTMLAVLLAVLGTQVYAAWGDLGQVGIAMVRVLTVTTAAGLLLGTVYHQRIWCHICPMGTLSGYIGEGKKPLAISTDACVDCKACSRVCPMQLKPFEYKQEGIMGDTDCIKCSTCVAACPKKALSFAQPELKKAA